MFANAMQCEVSHPIIPTRITSAMILTHSPAMIGRQPLHPRHTSTTSPRTRGRITGPRACPLPPWTTVYPQLPPFSPLLTSPPDLAGDRTAASRSSQLAIQAVVRTIRPSVRCGHSTLPRHPRERPARMSKCSRLGRPQLLTLGRFTSSTFLPAPFRLPMAI